MKNNPKKTLIMRTAIRCISQYGIEGASADVIAKKLGIAQSGIFYYFPTQAALFDSLDGFIAATNHDMVTRHVESCGAVTAWQRLQAHLRGNLLWAQKHPDQVSALLVGIARTGRSRASRERINKLFKVGEQRLKELLAEGLATGEFEYEGDVESLACFVHKSLTGILIGAYYSRQWRPLPFFEAALESNLALVLTRHRPTVTKTKPRGVPLFN